MQTAVETASIQTKPELRGVKERAVNKITLFSSVRGGGLPFGKANAYVFVGAVSTAVLS